jgi:CheY-like chemotaxis protein/anti-sigma regulatory factor (Ser/Thr protein kinase)
VMLTAILERATEIAAPLIARHGHKLRVAKAGDVALIGDPVRLAQVFGNLLNNAAKFTPPGGVIEIAVEQSASNVTVRVRDNGRGIERSSLSKIFEPFVQLDQRGDQLRGGLGLGLAIVRDLVVRHGGSIRAESDGHGRGTTFTVVLPIVESIAPPPPVTRAGARAARKGIRVLVVDDNMDIAELLSVALGLEGFQTDVALDAHAALDRWRAFVPHAGVLDVGLPDLDGYELARSIREEHGAHPTLIAATGYGQAADRKLAAEAGFDCHLVKPVSIKELVSVLDLRVVEGERHVP